MHNGWTNDTQASPNINLHSHMAELGNGKTTGYNLVSIAIRQIAKGCYEIQIQNWMELGSINYKILSMYEVNYWEN